jgi:hypothetical protein
VTTWNWSRAVPWSGPAALLGGALWIAGCVLTATRPEGCVGDACDLPGRSMREGTAVDAGLLLASMLLIGFGLVGLVLRARTGGRFGRLGRIGAVLAGGALATLAGAGLIQAVFFAGDFPLMPWFVIPGVLALILGVLLIGVAVLRARVLPRWVGGLLIVGALALLGFNDQDARVLLGVPFGMAWIAVGLVPRAGSVDPRSGARPTAAPILPRPS